MLTSPRNIFLKAHEWKLSQTPFVMATVIAVRGSASAKTGSKAIFDAEGRNVMGWVGGGCAQSLLAREAIEVLKQKCAKIIHVDLDDEVFGLMPCGGVMDVYLEPHFPAPVVELPRVGEWQEPMGQFMHQLGFDTKVGSASRTVTNWSEAFVVMAESFGRELKPLRLVERPLPQLPTRPSSFALLGETRISEELFRMGTLLGWQPKIQSPHLKLTPIQEGAWVVVASNHAQDHEAVAHAVASKAAYVALVASRKRAGLIPQDSDSYFAPAGLSIHTETPSQIAFSIVCEILYCQGMFHGQRA